MINQKADLLIAVKFSGKNDDALVWFAIKKKTRTNIDVEKVIAKIRKQPKQKQNSDCPFQQLKNYGVSDRKAKEFLEIFKPSEIKKVIDELECDLQKICNPAAWLVKRFNSKTSEHIKFTGAKPCKGMDFIMDELQRKHLAFVKERVQNSWNKLPEERKNTLAVTFEKWMTGQDIGFIMSTGMEQIYHQIFLEQVLLTPEERNFESWAALQCSSQE
ncbi:hypothetical protein HYX58_04325 [Candidatus Dependentiae bacterium]|nr:hypothetical protein [Candidatus Dependentiae bacterium]